jgi:uncharacterized membrane protein
VNDQRPLARLELHLGYLLVTGVVVAAVCLCVGLALYVMAPDSALAMRLLEAGLYVLMATPILRVVVSVVEYVRMRDWFFTLTTLAVLTELGITLLYAFSRAK